MTLMPLKTSDHLLFGKKVPGGRGGDGQLVLSRGCRGMGPGRMENKLVHRETGEWDSRTDKESLTAEQIGIRQTHTQMHRQTRNSTLKTHVDTNSVHIQSASLNTCLSFPWRISS